MKQKKGIRLPLVYKVEKEGRGLIYGAFHDNQAQHFLEPAWLKLISDASPHVGSSQVVFCRHWILLFLK